MRFSTWLSPLLYYLLLQRPSATTAGAHPAGSSFLASAGGVRTCMAAACAVVVTADSMRSAFVWVIDVRLASGIAAGDSLTGRIGALAAGAELADTGSVAD